MEFNNPRFGKFKKVNISQEYNPELDIGDIIQISTPFGNVPATIVNIIFTPDEKKIYKATTTFLLKEEDLEK